MGRTNHRAGKMLCFESVPKIPKMWSQPVSRFALIMERPEWTCRPTGKFPAVCETGWPPRFSHPVWNMCEKSRRSWRHFSPKAWISNSAPCTLSRFGSTLSPKNFMDNIRLYILVSRNANSWTQLRFWQFHPHFSRPLDPPSPYTLPCLLAKENILSADLHPPDM